MKGKFPKGEFGVLLVTLSKLHAYDPPRQRTGGAKAAHGEPQTQPPRRRRGRAWAAAETRCLHVRGGFGVAGVRGCPRHSPVGGGGGAGSRWWTWSCWGEGLWFSRDLMMLTWGKKPLCAALSATLWQTPLPPTRPGPCACRALPPDWCTGGGFRRRVFV